MRLECTSQRYRIKDDIVFHETINEACLAFQGWNYGAIYSVLMEYTTWPRLEQLCRAFLAQYAVHGGRDVFKQLLRRKEREDHRGFQTQILCVT